MFKGSIKSFFKPNTGKIIITLIIIALTYFLATNFMYGAGDQPPIGHSFFSPLITLLIFPLLIFLSALPETFFVTLSAIILNIAYLYIISCLVVIIYNNRMSIVVKLWQDRPIGKLIIVMLFLAIISAFSLFIYFDVRTQARHYSRPKISRIVEAISQARSIMSTTCQNEGCDNFTCNHKDMIILCQKIDIAYNRKDDDKEPIIVWGTSKNFKTACIYSPLSPENDYWYCADSMGKAGFTEINPGTAGYCVEGKSAVCPPVS